MNIDKKIAQARQELLSDLYYMYAGIKKRVRTMEEYQHVKAAGYSFC